MKGRKRREIKGDVDLLSQHLGISASKRRTRLMLDIFCGDNIDTQNQRFTSV
jgi:hypothetical protein